MVLRALTTALFMYTTQLFATEIIFWHSLTPPLADHLKETVSHFESQHPDVTIRLVYKGNYSQLPVALLETDPSQRPHLVQVAEYHFHTFKNLPDLYIPLDKLVDSSELNLTSYAEGFYQKKSRTPALPFNISAGVMYINWQAWEKAGLTEKDVPRTWNQVRSALEKLRQAGFGGLSTAWPAAYFFEHYAAQADLPWVVGDEINLKHPAFTERLNDFVDLAKADLYLYGGRFSDAEDLFTTKRASVFFQGASRSEKITK